MYRTEITEERWVVYHDNWRLCLSVHAQKLGVAFWTEQLKETWLFEDEHLAKAFIAGHKLSGDASVERVTVTTTLTDLDFMDD
jgi:hypothetical protein